MKEIKKEWDEILKSLHPSINDTTYETFFTPLKPLGLDEENCIIYLDPDYDLIMNVLNNRYMHLIEGALYDYFGKKYTVSFKYTEDFDTFIGKAKKKNSAKNNLFNIMGEGFKEEFYLNPKYNFSTFVKAKNNEFAHAAAVAVAETPAEAYNPLFIYGSSGLGKTHLMHAIGHYILKNKHGLKVLYVSSEMFTNELIKAIGENKTAQFRKKYRSIDVLLIDDIQFIEKKESTQEEFFHTFNSLYEENKQIVITSDRPPNKLTNIEDRLRSRFQWNIIADIQPPDTETRAAILENKAQLENIELTDDMEAVIRFIAERVKNNIRELEGAFTRVIAHSTLMKQTPNVAFAKNVLKDVISPQDISINIEYIKKKVCKHFNIKVMEIESSKRTRNLAFPRQIAMYLSREMTDLSLPKIGDAFGGRDHTTVMHACDKISSEIKMNPSIKEIVNNLRTDIEDI